jgi:hypothetical protein
MDEMNHFNNVKICKNHIKYNPTGLHLEDKGFIMNMDSNSLLGWG